MKRTGGYTPSLHSSSSGNRSSGNSGRGTTHMSTILMLLFLAGLGIMETVKKDITTTVAPIETKYSFDTLEECQLKHNQLKAQNNIDSGLRCVPDGDTN